VYSEHN